MENWAVAKTCNTHLIIVNSHVNGELPPLSEKLLPSATSCRPATEKIELSTNRTRSDNRHLGKP